MGKTIAIVLISLFIITGTSYGEPANPFIVKNDDLYLEGWFGSDSNGSLSGMLTVDIISRGYEAWTRIEYSGISDFQKCSIKPENWTCQYDSESNILSLICTFGEFSPNERISFVIMYNNPSRKILTGNGYIQYSNSDTMNKLDGLTRVMDLP
jgi:hypothetical protein